MSEWWSSLSDTDQFQFGILVWLFFCVVAVGLRANAAINEARKRK